MDVGATLMFSLLFGSIGIGYFIYGKRQSEMVPLLAGISLCAFPYFISNVYAMVVVGAVLIAVPWVMKRYYG